MMAASPTTPTTTPAAMPAVFGLLEPPEELSEGEAAADVAAAAADVEGPAVDEAFDDDESAGIE